MVLFIATIAVLPYAWIPHAVTFIELIAAIYIQLAIAISLHILKSMGLGKLNL